MGNEIIMIGNRLKEVRDYLKINQKVFADKLGISAVNLSRYENEIVALPDDIKIILIKDYNVNPLWLLLGEGDMFINNDADADVSFKEMLPVISRLADLNREEKNKVIRFIDELQKGEQ